MTSSIAVMMVTPRGTWPSAACGIIVALLVSVACHTGTATQAPSATAAVPARVANLHAFARIYGVVRWFHPSDAAATIDWNRFAVEGARRVIDAPDERTLRVALARPDRTDRTDSAYRRRWRAVSERTRAASGTNSGPRRGGMGTQGIRRQHVYHRVCEQAAASRAYHACAWGPLCDALASR